MGSCDLQDGNQERLPDTNVEKERVVLGLCTGNQHLREAWVGAGGGGPVAMSSHVEAELCRHLHSVVACLFRHPMSHEDVKSPPLGMIFSIIMKKRSHRAFFEPDCACRTKGKVPRPLVSGP